MSQPIQDIGEWISAGNMERWFAGAAGLRSELQGKCRTAGADLADHQPELSGSQTTSQTVEVGQTGGNGGVRPQGAGLDR